MPPADSTKNQDDSSPEPSSDAAVNVNPDWAEEKFGLEIESGIIPRGYNLLPVTGLGGSAGSLAGLKTFFAEVPANTGMAFVVVVHLSPEHDSILAQILQKETSMPVIQVTKYVKVAPNHVYVIPPAKHLTMLNGHLKLSEPDQPRGKRVAVDLFFRTLAATHGPHATAIVLSGGDADGSIGIKRVKECGGLTIAQDPLEAEHTSMPRSAISTGMVDWVLPIAEIPRRIITYRANESKINLPTDDTGLSEDNQPKETTLREVLAFLRMQTGRDFAYYKRATVLRRIARRMQVNNITDLGEYLTFLRMHPGETGALLQDLLISVTNFFRDRHAYDELNAHLPSLFAGKGPQDHIRVWVAACATGEEAYSLAILLCEYAESIDGPPQIQIFATDLDEGAIASAREGSYPDTIIADVSEARLKRFFTKEPGGYRVKREIRERVLFALHDLLKDSPFSRLDLISCRNLLIYLNREAQSRSFDIFHFALRHEGILFLGTSESAEESAALFSPLSKNHRVYGRKVSNRVGLPVSSGTHSLSLSLQAHMRAMESPVIATGNSIESPRPQLTNADLANSQGIPWERLHYRLIERIAPPSLIVNGDHDVVHLSENSGRFLQITGGKPTTNLLRLVHPMLRIELRTALFRASQSQLPAKTSGIPIELEGMRSTVNLSVYPINDLAPDLLLVVFDEQDGREPVTHSTAEPESLVRHLEHELEHVKSQLRDTVEQYEASIEELKASNEELQAMNEELRSATEELETSREELQSINEELTTVNQELKGKVEEVSHANSDLQNLMASTDIATIFLDRYLHIKRYTPSAVAIFNLIPTDVGRPLSDLSHHLQYDLIASDAARVLDTLCSIEREIRDLKGRWFLARLLPYRTIDDVIAGVVLTFVDITERKNAVFALDSSEERYRTLFNSIDEGLCIIEVMFATDGQPYDYRFLEVNPAFEKLTGISHAIGKTMRSIAPQHEQHWYDLYGKVAQTGESTRFEHEAAALKRRYEGYTFRIDGPNENRIAVLFNDITHRKEMETELTESRKRLEAIIAQANVGLSELSLDGRFIFTNDEIARIAGRSREELLATDIATVTHPDDLKSTISAAEHVARTGEFVSVNKRYLHPDGTAIYANSGLARLDDENGKPRAILAVTIDLTERKMAEEALEKSRNELLQALEDTEKARAAAEASDQMKDHFLAILSHELRTPLTPVLMAVQSLQEEIEPTPQVQETLEMIERNVLLETNLIADLLDITRISRGKMEVSPVPMNLQDSLKNALEVCKSDFEAKKQLLEIQLHEQDDLMHGDSVRLQQVFWNLLKNASKFTPAEGKIKIHSTVQDHQFIVKIADSGIGISPDNLKDIFIAFRQGDQTISRNFGGLGLGLAISKATIDAHRGELKVESEGHGKGSTFTISLPAFSTSPSL